MPKFARTLAVLLLAFPGSAAFAHEFTLGPLKIGHPWSRATPAGAKVGGGYLTIENTGSAPDRLVAVSVPFASRGEIHEMAVKDGVMTMRELEKGIDIPVGAKVELKPGGYHLMFQELRQPLKQGETMKGALTFEKAGTIEVEFKVESIGARGGSEPAGGHKH